MISGAMQSNCSLESLSRRLIELAVRPEVRRSHLVTFATIDAVDQTRLATLPQPVMLIHGRDDRIIPLDVRLRLLGDAASQQPACPR
jgi:hypothetical protein